MASLLDLIQKGSAVPFHRPWPRVAVTEDIWRFAAAEMAAGSWTLLGLWGESQAVHMAVADDESGAYAIVTLECPGGTFPSVAQIHAPALRLERTIADLFGLVAEDSPDPRPWLDHGRWDLKRPLGDRVETSAAPPPYAFLPAAGESLHQIAVGPVHAGIIEPGHFRFTANGETIVRLEERLGYAHKGIESLMAGAALDKAARLAGRASGDSTVAYAYAFARAVEAALGTAVPPRAIFLRALMAELERLANHFGDIGAVSNDAGFALLHAHFGILREGVLRAAEACFGHRLMMDHIVPGGVAGDLERSGIAQSSALLEDIRARFPKLVDLYDNTASLQDRTVGAGVLQPQLARQYGCGGFVGRASGRAFDARRTPGYPPYDRLRFNSPVLQQGDVNARIWIRIREIEQSVSLIEQILTLLPEGPIRTAVEWPESGSREGVALVEGFRGDVLVWLRLAGGNVERCHLRDPSWFQWPVLEAAIEGNIVGDFPLCNKSFNCSYSGHDL